MIGLPRAIGGIAMALAMTSGHGAMAQTRPVTATPPATQVPSAPASQARQATATSRMNPPAPAGAAGTAAIGPPASWLPRETATLQFLDKINAQSGAEAVKNGNTAQYGSITVLVRACLVRPADRPADAAAYVVVTDSNATAPVFSGWLLRSAPALSMLEHPIYDLRVTGCTA